MLGLMVAVIIEFFRSRGQLTFLHLMPFGIGLFLGFNLAFLIAIGGFIALKVQKKGSQEMLTAIIISAAILGGEGTIGFLRSTVLVFSQANESAILGTLGLILIALLARSIRHYVSSK